MDASFHAENMSGACGVVARDEHGNFLTVASWTLLHVSLAESAEIRAIRSGITLASNIGCTKVIMEYDCMNALEAIAHPEAYLGPDIPIITEATLVDLEFPAITFVHCYRKANLVVDRLAKHCLSITFV